MALESHASRFVRRSSSIATTGTMAVFGKYDPRKRDRNSPFAHPVAARGDTAEWRRILRNCFEGRKDRDEYVERVLLKFKNYEDDFMDAYLFTKGEKRYFKLFQKKLPLGACHICGQMGHTIKDCPDADAFRQSTAEDLGEFLMQARIAIEKGGPPKVEKRGQPNGGKTREKRESHSVLVESEAIPAVATTCEESFSMNKWLHLCKKSGMAAPALSDEQGKHR